MRFASIGSSNAGSYAAAGKSVADSSARIFKKQVDSRPDYGMISQVAMQTASNEKIKGMKAEAYITNIGIDQYSKTKRIANYIEADEKIRDIKSSQRKAGILPAIGSIAGASYLASKDNTKGRERPKADVKSINDQYRTDRDTTYARQTNEVDAYGTFQYPSSTPGTSAGKVATGTETLSLNPNTSIPTNGGFNLSNVIRYAEGTLGDKGYNTMFTGAQFADTSKHPRQINSSRGYSSDAAGAYQFLSPTWDNAKNALNLPDFSPASQEKAGAYLAQQRGVDTNKVYTNINEFKADIDKLSHEWASLPTAATGTSYYGQGGKSIHDLWRVYQGQ